MVDSLPSKIVGEWMMVTHKKKNNKSKNKGKNPAMNHANMMNNMHEATVEKLNEVGLQPYSAFVTLANTKKWVKKKGPDKRSLFHLFPSPVQVRRKKSRLLG